MKTQDIKNMALAFQAVTEKYGKKKEDAYNDARPGTKQNQKDFDKASKMAAPKDKVSLKPMPASLAQKMKSEELKGGQHKLDHDSVEEAVDLEMHKKAAADHAAKASGQKVLNIMIMQPKLINMQLICTRSLALIILVLKMQLLLQKMPATEQPMAAKVIRQRVCGITSASAAKLVSRS
jgi:hypothetical protein